MVRPNLGFQPTSAQNRPLKAQIAAGHGLKCSFGMSFVMPSGFDLVGDGTDRLGIIFQKVAILGHPGLMLGCGMT